METIIIDDIQLKTSLKIIKEANKDNKKLCKLIRHIQQDDIKMTHFLDIEGYITFGMLTNILSNYDLFYTYSDKCLLKYRSFSAAFDKLAIDRILIYHHEINLYGIYGSNIQDETLICSDFITYLLAINNVNDKKKDVMKYWKMSQILRNDHPQKVVFLCLNQPDIINRFQKHIKIGLNSDCIITDCIHDTKYVQITIIKTLAQSNAEVLTIIDQLSTYIQKYDNQLSIVKLQQYSGYIDDNETGYIKTYLDSRKLLNFYDYLGIVVVLNDHHGSRDENLRNNGYLKMNTINNSIICDTENTIENNSNTTNRIAIIDSTQDNKMVNVSINDNQNDTNMDGNNSNPSIAEMNIDEILKYLSMRQFNKDEISKISNFAKTKNKELEKEEHINRIRTNSINWICSNPPKHKELTVNYLGRYFNHFIDKKERLNKRGFNDFALEILNSNGFKFSKIRTEDYKPYWRDNNENNNP
jgi:hypothetical protein